ncbi:MAG: ERMES complex subunit [Candelina submexicana]|nr:MAG: ERMES complex subunit [Candelina submexicana]
MAFNFNWSPLTADSLFYSRARELLTTALNKSPKPPIIVDDILVNELNLGSVPPQLEILEIGDLAEDRFRGIFKMCYSGDAFLTLKTRVQANPLNTYLSTKPSFASPRPLAAASGLTIPLQITLSDIKLSAFIILVFSRQKGLTLVFRNDPLESLKVSSTFDSIPFVREYLQKEIEGQLRDLLMDEVPAIIHRLSLRLWVPEYRASDDEEAARSGEVASAKEMPIDPLASPPQDPVDPSGHIYNPAEISSLLLDPGPETHALFSQKNLLRLAALTDSHRTLSLFTPSLRDAVFRAWAVPNERGDVPGTNTPVTSMMLGLNRMHSYTGSLSTTYTLSDASSSGAIPTRPSLMSYGSTNTGLSMGAGKHGRAHAGRRKKNRIVNLRRSKSSGEVTGSASGEGSTPASASVSAFSDEATAPATTEDQDEVVTPPRTPKKGVRFQQSQDSIDLGDTSKLRPLTPTRQSNFPTAATGNAKKWTSSTPVVESANNSKSSTFPQASFQEAPSQQHPSYSQEKPPLPRLPSTPLTRSLQDAYTPASASDSHAGGILEQAWILKMAGEIARRVQDEKSRNGPSSADEFWGGSESNDAPPPAYGA